MPIADVMRARLVSVKPDDPVQEAIRKMLDRGVGAVAVCDGPRLAGIFTERDVLRLAGSGAPFAGLRVGDVMTTDLVTVAPDDDIEAVAHLMGEHRIRHVPVVQGGNVLGIVGIRDIVAVLAEKLWREHDPAARETVHELLSRPAP